MLSKNLTPPDALKLVTSFVSEAEGLRFKSRTGQIGQILPTALHRCDISSKGAVLPGRNDAEMMGPANSLHAST